MDPELQQLFLLAAGTPSGASRTNDLLSQMLFGYISGGINANTLTGQGSAGSSRLMQNYMQDPNPAMQQIIAHIQGGTDPYRLSSFVDSIVGEMPDQVTDLGFQPSDLKNLALQMNREFTNTTGSGGSGGSGGGYGQSGFDFAKAGLSNPLDVYDITNAPLSDEAMGLISRQRKEGERGAKEFESSSQKARSASRAMEDKPGQVFRTFDTDAFNKALNRVGSGVENPGGWSVGETQMLDAISRYIDENEGVADEAGIRKAANKAIQNMYGGYRSGAQNLLDKSLKEAKKTSVTSVDVDVNSPEFWAWRKNIENARKAAYNEQEAARGEMAVRQGALDAANKAGRTPLNDELKGRLSTLARLRNK
jgi:hypothetical protein